MIYVQQCAHPDATFKPDPPLPVPVPVPVYCLSNLVVCTMTAGFTCSAMKAQEHCTGLKTLVISKVSAGKLPIFIIILENLLEDTADELLWKGTANLSGIDRSSSLPLYTPANVLYIDDVIAFGDFNCCASAQLISFIRLDQTHRKKEKKSSTQQWMHYLHYLLQGAD